MSKVKELENRQLAIVKRQDELAALSEQTEESRKEYMELRAEALTVATDLVIEKDKVERQRAEYTAELGDVETPESREIIALHKRADFGSYIGFAVDRRDPDGAHKELAEVFQVERRSGEGVDIPWYAFLDDAAVADIEKRASTLGAEFDNEQRLQAALTHTFNPATMTDVGITPTSVPSGTATFVKMVDAGTAGQYAQGAPVAPPDDTPFTTIQLDAKRASAAISWQLEDSIRYPMIASQLRAHLRAKLIDVMDTQVLSGDGTGANLTGLINQLAQPAAVSDEATFAAYQLLAANLIDGLHQREESQVRFLVRDQTVKHMASKVSAGDAIVNALRYLQATVTIRASQKVPAAPTSGQRAGNATVLAYRPDNAFNRSPAAYPVFGGGPRAVMDPYTQAGKAETQLFLHGFHNFDLIDAGAWNRGAVKITA